MTMITKTGNDLQRSYRNEMNWKRAMLGIARKAASEAHKAGDYKKWSRLMRQAKRLKSQMMEAAENLHTMLWAMGKTTIKPKSE